MHTLILEVAPKCNFSEEIPSDLFLKNLHVTNKNYWFISSGCLGVKHEVSNIVLDY